MYYKTMLKFRTKLNTKQKREIAVESLTWDIVESRDIAVECLQGLTYVKMHYDIDMKLSKYTMDREKYERVKDNFMKVLEKTAPLHNFVFTKHASREWRSETDGKISTHIIFQNKYIYRGIRPEKAYLIDHFRSTVVDGMPEEEAQLWVDSIDTAVYSNGIDSDNCFRMTGKGDKTGKKTHHHPMTPDDPVSLYMLTPTTQRFSPDDALTLYSEVNVKVADENVDAVRVGEKKPRGRPKKLEVGSIPQPVLEKMFRGLDAEKRAYEYKDWSSLLLLCKTLLGEEGLAVFLEISEASGYEDYDEEESSSAYERAFPNGSFTEGTLIFWLKEDNPELCSQLCAEAGHRGRDQCDLVYYKTYSVNFMKDLMSILNRDTLTLVRDATGQIWCKLISDKMYTNCWVPIHKQDLPYRLLESRISILKIGLMEPGEDGVKLTLVNRNLDFLQEKVFRYMHDFISIEPAFDLMFESNMKKLCFRNGVLDMPTDRFTSWKMNPTIQTKVVLPYDYRYVKSESDKIINEKLIPVCQTYFGTGKIRDDEIRDDEKRDDEKRDDEKEEDIPERWELPLMKMARIIAGEYDKLAHLLQSKRNGGKSAFLKAIENALPGYVQTFNSGMIMTQKLSMKQDPTRELGPWLSLANSGCRFAYCQEARSTEEDNSNAQYLNSCILKLLTGRDPLRARKMYQDDSASQTVRHQMTIGICCNKVAKATDNDVFESCCFTKFPHQFLKQDVLDAYKENGAYCADFHRLADPSQEVEFAKYGLYWIHLIVRYYRSTVYPIDRVNSNGDLMDDIPDENDATCEFFKLLNTHFVKDSKAHVSHLQINNFRTSHDFVFTSADVRSKLEAMGAKESKTIKIAPNKYVRGLKGLRYVSCEKCQSEMDNLPK
jgi:hypothetical protein